jgi:hypothetical protein
VRDGAVACRDTTSRSSCIRAKKKLLCIHALRVSALKMIAEMRDE